ncbi:hypothetical protein ABG768_024704 [Culter alburnus]|uniref:Uncharacterized protein n=1 Tax=Culter alburnus TaxID=194366 RepID=A0AAW2ACL8_CULAL
MASYRHQHRRRSKEEPPDISDVNDLKEELYKLHEKISPECQEHIKKMNTLVKEFEEDYRHAVRVSTGGAIAAGIGGVAMIVGIALSVFTLGASAIVAGIGAAAAGGGGIACGIGKFKKTQKEKNLRKSLEDQLTELQTKISPVIDLLKKIFCRVQDIMRNPKLSEHQANAIRECFYYCFEKIQLFQIDDNRGVGSPMRESLRLTGNLSKTFAEMSSMLDLLDEIIEDDDEGQNDNDRPADTKKEKELEKEFKEKADKFIDEMKKGINQLENVMKEIYQIKIRLSIATWQNKTI